MNLDRPMRPLRIMVVHPRALLCAGHGVEHVRCARHRLVLIREPLAAAPVTLDEGAGVLVDAAVERVLALGAAEEGEAGLD